jgi:hypothetical protein
MAVTGVMAVMVVGITPMGMGVGMGVRGMGYRGMDTDMGTDRGTPVMVIWGAWVTDTVMDMDMGMGGMGAGTTSLGHTHMAHMHIHMGHIHRGHIHMGHIHMGHRGHRGP